MGFSSCWLTSCRELVLYNLGWGGYYLLGYYFLGGSSLLGYSLGCSFVINMRFCNGILGGSLMGFFYSGKESSFSTNFKSFGY